MSLPANIAPLFSSLSDDPAMLEQVEAFVGNLKSQVRSLEVAYASDDAESLAQLARQLENASGGHGFEPIEEAAARLEDAARNADSVNEAAAALEALVSMCRRACATPRPDA